MTTSGTVGSTVLDLAKLVEKTYRRCGIPTGGITPELIDIAKENLFLLFQDFSNRGINLWCVEYPLIGLNDHQSNYQLPLGSLDILNANFRRVTTLTDTVNATTATSEAYDVATAQTVNMVGFKLGTASTGVTVSGSSDAITYTTYATKTTTYAAGIWYWVALPTTATLQYWKLTFPTATTITNHSISSTFTDIKMSLLNWDDYMNLPTKRTESNTPLQFAFDKLMTKEMVLWPVPNDMNNGCIALRVHRQIQDVGSLTQTIEVPDRWIDAVTWNLAALCAVETPVVAADRLQMVQQKAMESIMNADRGETDGSANYLQPNIDVYTR